MSLKTAYLKSFSKPYATASLIVLAALLTACGGGGGGGSGTPPPPPPPPATYMIGGTISGLSGGGLMLQDNGGDTLAVSAGATTFTFATAVQSGKAYAVTVSAQPTSPAQTCTVTGGSGTVAAANVTNVSITCVTGAVTVGGTISGLTASGLVLQDNGGDNLTVASGATTFTFATPVLTGAAYAVTVSTQPTGETCTVSGGSGSAGAAAVTTVSIVCSSVTVTVGGTITGLVATGLVLQDNGGDNLPVSPGAAFTFATPVSEGAPYNVTVLTQPSGAPLETCTVTNGSGTAGATNITSVVVTCVPATFSVGGTITGYSGTGLMLQDNGGDNVTVANAATTFTFPTALPVGATYAVTVATQPSSPAAVCTVANPSGTVVAGNVTTVTVNCVAVGRYVYVVNSQDNAGGSGDVAAFAINPLTGALTPIAGGPVSADNTPTAIAVDHTGQFAYVTNKGSSDVTFFDIGSNGALTMQTNYPTPGIAQTAIAVAPSNQYVYTGGYGAAWGFSLNPTTGALTNASGAPFTLSDDLAGVAVDPTNSFVYATSAFSTDLYGFTIGTTGNLTQTTGSPFAGAHGGGVAIWPLGTASNGYVYIADNSSTLNGNVSGFQYDSTGNLTAIPGTPIHTQGFSPTGITIDPAGTYLYVTNAAAGDSNIASFQINPSTGGLTLVGVVNSCNLNSAANDSGPIDVKVDPSNQYVYVVNGLDGSICEFSTNAGVLTLKNSYQTGATARAAGLAVF
jgi:6-phosphogluconolactonase (cycloisomerase 2 family)